MNLKRLLLLAVIFLIAQSLTAQINFPADSIKTTLCQKWVFKAIIMGGQRLTNMNETVTYEFAADGTFKRNISGGKTQNGTWVYQPEQKIVLLKIKKTALHIASLSNAELIVAPGNGLDETKNVMGMGTVLKTVGNNLL